MANGFGSRTLLRTTYIYLLSAADCDVRALCLQVTS